MTRESATPVREPEPRPAPGEGESDYVSLHGPRGEVLYASPAVERLFGWRPSELLGRTPAECVHPDDLAMVEGALGEIGPSRTLEFRFRCADGGYRWVESESRPLGLENGARGFVCVVREVHERRRRGRAPARRGPLVRPQHPSSEDGYLATSAAGALLSWNSRLWEVWGIAPEEASRICGAGPESLAAFREAALRRVAGSDAAGLPDLSGGSATSGDVPLADGRILEHHGAPVRDAEGRPAGRVSFFRDVTGRRCAESELRERARQQEAVALLSRSAIDSDGLDPVVETALRALRHTLGVAVSGLFEAAPGRGGFFLRAGSGFRAFREGASVMGSPAALLSKTLLAPAAVPLAGAAEGTIEDDLRDLEGVTCGIAVAVRGKDGPFGVLAAWSREPRSFGGGEAHFAETLASVLGSVVARHQAEQALRERERQLGAVVENSLDAILILDHEGRILTANPAAARLTGRSPEEVAGASIFSLVEPERGDEVQVPWRRLLEEGRVTGVVDLRPPGEPTRTVELSGVAHIQPRRHLLVLRDVTERTQMQARLALADRMSSVGTLAAGVAHELNNPLAYVVANLAFLDEALSPRRGGAAGGVANAAEVQEALREAREGAERMRVIVRDLHTFSRRDDEREGPVELASLLESCVNMAWNEIRHRAELVRDLAPVPPVSGSAARLGQVFLNLLVNAAQAIPEGHRDRNEIRLVARPGGDGRVAVEVRDTGGGIPPENLPRIFDPFFTTRMQRGGTGLGLFICHNIVSSLGGEIAVESQVGRGSTFRVLLPTAEDAGAAAPAPERLGGAGQRGRILVVDDEPLVASAIRRALDREHDVTVFSDARPALARIAAGARFDLLLCDLLMPEMSGIEFHEEIRRLDPTLARQTLFLTGGAFTDQARAFLEREGVRHLEKPFSLEVLRETVRARLAGDRSLPDPGRG